MSRDMVDMYDLFVRCFVGFFFSSRIRHTRLSGDWSSDVCSSDLVLDCPQAHSRDHQPPSEPPNPACHPFKHRSVPGTLNDRDESLQALHRTFRPLEVSRLDWQGSSELLHLTGDISMQICIEVFATRLPLLHILELRMLSVNRIDQLLNECLIGKLVRPDRMACDMLAEVLHITESALLEQDSSGQ